MLSLLFKGLAAFLSAYTFILLFPAPSPFRVEEFIGECILNPSDFLASMIAFLIGFLCLGTLITEFITMCRYKIKRKSKEIMLLILSILSILLLLQIGFWQIVIFYGFGIIYGMMSLREKSVQGG
ncbi:MAG TPA: hypothetical protein VNM69_08020 [Bacillus sp. (in: firmicutes)]|uniref:hypothetical protein n=1 Tax=Bacillus litorisediminis TaxID=2922713 RepID=UPI001FAEFCA4|nr:hypothetical protein [Bacillus litorisediminis]HWO75837.1 hypothetical protein [Bacillus sp. (in: firmicutes)]